MTRALVVVDIQRDYFPGGKRAPNAFLGAGADLGFQMTVVPDACAAPALSFDGRDVAAEDVHDAFVAALGMGYATIASAEELAAGLAG